MSMTISADVISLNTIHPRPLKWLWEPRIPLGKLTLLIGDPEHGKSLQYCDWTARVTRGTSWPDGASCPQGCVLFLEAEDGLEDTVIPRLQAAKANLSHVRTWKRLNLDGLAEHIKEEGTIAVLISPLNTYLPAINSWKDDDVRRALQPLVNTAQETGAAIVGIMHPPKNQSLKEIHQVPGSVAFGAVARSVLFVDKYESGYVLETRKKNLAPADVPSLTYSIKVTSGGIPYIEWGSPLSAEYRPAPRPRPDEAPLFDAACEFLVSMLAGSDGFDVKELVREAQAHGISPRTLYNAGKTLNIVKERSGHGKQHKSVWRLPAGSPYIRRSDCKSEKVLL